MTNLEIINLLKEKTFTDEDDRDYRLEFQEGLSDQQIESLRTNFPNRTLSNELIEILKITKGWTGHGPSPIFFDSIGYFGFEEFSQHSIELGGDGLGNSWILDIDDKGILGKVFFACHDPAVVVIHSQNLNEYLHHLYEFYEQPGNNHLDEIHEKTVMTIWENNSDCISKNSFLEKNPKFSDYMKKYESANWTVADLREGKNKLGFA